MKTTKISVVVTAYNHEKYIAQCLDSILIQKGAFDLEVILGDDCSTDRTRQIMQEYIEKHPDIFVLLPPTANMGVTKNIKRCLDACSGDYIAFCEGDDYWTDSYKLQKQVEFLQEYQDYVMCFNAIMYYLEKENRYAPNVDQLIFERDYLTIDDLLKNNNVIVNFSCCMYRTSIVKKLPDELYDMPIADWMFNMACSRFGKLGFIRDWMSVWRIHSKGAWSGKSYREQYQEVCQTIDASNKFFNYEYNEQFSKLKDKISRQYKHRSEKLGISYNNTLYPAVPWKEPFIKKYGGLLIRAIRHPGQAYNRLSSTISIALAELTTGVPSAMKAQLEELKSAMPVKDVGLLILDTLFPHPLSRFRLEEFCAYLKHFENSMVLSTGEHFAVVKETKSLGTSINEFESLHPEFIGRTRATTHDIDGYSARLAYLIFLNNVSYFLESLGKKEIPFIFTLYPGGGFEINQKGSDSMLRRIFSSVQFRKVIVTQQITYDYLVKNNFCEEDRIAYIFGGVMPLDILNKSKSYQRKFFGFEKNCLDICFVAAKYIPMGIDKGYDVFIEVAKKLVQSYSNINFHVVGNFSEADIPINGLEDKITFHGFQTLEWFDKFYVDKDIILSPNIPFTLSKGAFDGFPTTACVEASLRKVAVFCADELKLNNHFINNEEIVIIPHDAGKIVRIIEAFYKEPAKLRSIGEKGAIKACDVFSYERQIIPRIRLIESEMYT